MFSTRFPISPKSETDCRITISFVEFVYSNVFKKEAYRLSHNNKLVEENNDKFNNMVGTANGRIYYKISNWYALIKFLPLSKKIIPIWQDMLGVKNKNYDDGKLKIPFLTKIKTYFNTIKELKNVSKNMDKLNLYNPQHQIYIPTYYYL